MALKRDFCLWHLTDNQTATTFVRLRAIPDKVEFWPQTVCPRMTQSGQFTFRDHPGGQVESRFESQRLFRDCCQLFAERLRTPLRARLFRQR
jgi:hypothetical protein